jgi:glutamate formiminotransferase/formiminotetrahydrofolate cyclodeaminase
METAVAAMDVILKMAEIGNPNSVSDAGVGALCACAAVRGAGLNVRINTPGLTDRAYAAAAVARAEAFEHQALERERETLVLVRKTT